MIYTLTLNPSIDYNINTKDFKIGKLNITESEHKLPGGKGINVSQVLKNLESSSIALGYIGGFTGRYIEDELNIRGIKNDFILVSGDTRINIKMKEGSVETEINGNSPIITPENKRKLFEKLLVLEQNDILVLSGSIPKSLNSDIYSEIMKIINKGVKVIVDTKGKHLIHSVKEKPFLIKPNIDELEEFFNTKLDSMGKIVNYAKELKEMGPENIIVSMASKGAILVSEKGVYFIEAPKGIVQSSVGAGDSLVAGFVSEISKNNTVVEAFKVGVSAGSSSVFSKNLCTKKEVESLLKNIKIIKL